MADLVAIHNAVADAITKGTGLRADGQARDQVTPPCAVVLPGQPYVNYGATLDSSYPGAVNINLVVLVIISDAAPVEKTQRALFAYLSAGEGAEGTSVADAIEADQTLGGTVHYVQAVTSAAPSRFEYANQTYFGSRITVIASAV